jgi:hypothetical protein
VSDIVETIKVNVGAITLDDMLDALTEHCERVDHAARASILWMIAFHPGYGLDYIFSRFGPNQKLALRAVRQLKTMGQIRERQSGGYEVAAAKS